MSTKKKTQEYHGYYSLILVAINFIIFFIETVAPWIVPIFALNPENVLSAPWTLITSMFLHADIEHLVYNMFALAWFGFILERVIDSRKFLHLYFIAGITSAIASIYAYPNSMSLGASGAIMGVIGILGVLRPKMMIYWGGVPLPMAFFAGLWIVFDVVGLFTPSNIGHVAHLTGFFVGGLFAYHWRKEYKETTRAKREVSNEIGDDDLDDWEKEFMRCFF
ncbi:MAG: rhomboid family intramembrane serine protease [DPANN group archaeon]|nr:rhomboid family intramembrane serine protease [DPANN group archaeon]